MRLRIDLQAQVFEMEIDASMIRILAQLLMLAGVLSSSHSMMI